MSWQYFNYETDKMLACSCCGVQGMDEQFMSILDTLRHDLGFPFIITSGYRCPNHNSVVSSTGATGPHTTGKAIDIGVYGDDAYKLVTAAQDYGITGIGIKQNGSYQSRFIHLDILSRPEQPRPWIWSY